jgi:hypothetical protein
MKDSCHIKSIGRCQIYDHNDQLIRDELNAIHPQNMARIFARALSNEHNYFINRIAFGNGGTNVDAAYNVTYRTANDGQYPDVSTWDSRLYNETFSKIINAGSEFLNPLLGTDPGSSDSNTGIRPGGSADNTKDPTSVLHISGPGVRSVDNGLSSNVIITAVLNENEPTHELMSNFQYPNQPTDAVMAFDEIGLYTSGGPAIPTYGYQLIDVGNKTSMDDTKLSKDVTYSFRVSINDGTPTLISFKTPISGGTGTNGAILYGDLCEAINNGSPEWGLLGSNPLPGNAMMSITDNSGGLYPSIIGELTNGYLMIRSVTTGPTSNVKLDSVSWVSRETSAFLTSLNSPIGGILKESMDGITAGLRNAVLSPSNERERLLTHLVFSPVFKERRKKLTIIYTITTLFARS